MLIALFIISPQRLEAPRSVRRVLSLTLTALVSIANGISLVLLQPTCATPTGSWLFSQGGSPRAMS